MITERAVGSTCLIKELGVEASLVLVRLDPRVVIFETGEAVVVPLPKHKGGAKFWEASHGKTIILGRVFSDHV